MLNSLLDVQIVGPQQAAVGSEAKFDITVTNRGTLPAEKLTLVDFYDSGLQFPKPDPTKPNEVKASLPTLGGNRYYTVPLTFKVTQPGQLSHRAEVRGPDGKLLAKSKPFILTAVGQAAPPTTPGGTGANTQPGGRYGEMPGDGTRAGTPANQSELAVKVTGPPTRKVGELAPFVIEITNTGTRTLHNLKVEAICDEALGIERAEATQGFKPENGVLIFLQPNLPPYEPKKTILPLDIHYECVKATPKAIVQVRVTSAEGAHGEGDTSTVIFAADKPVAETPGGTPALESRMQFDVTALRNPSARGE